MNYTSRAKLFIVVFSIVLGVASAIHAKQPAKAQSEPTSLSSALTQDPKPGEPKPAAQQAPRAAQTRPSPSRQRVAAAA